MAFKPQRNKKSNGKGCLFLIIGTILGVIASFLFIPLAGQMAAKIIDSSMAGQVGYVMLTAAEPCIAVAALFLFCILTVHYLDISDTKKDVRPSQKPQKEYKFLGSKAATWVVTGALVLCILLSAVVYATTYRAVTTEGISTTVCHFIKTGSYEWKQVSSYKVDCDEEKGLSVTLTMRDGKQFEILQSAISAPRSFHEAYECKEAFVLDLVTMLEEEYQITPNRSHIERAKAFYSDDEKLWPYVKEIIGYDELVPDAPETETSTKADTSDETEIESAPSDGTESALETDTSIRTE